MALAAAMALALIYSLGQYLNMPWLDIPAMLPTHGLLQAAGFVLCGLLGWHLSDRNVRGTAGQ
jgi:hypothetical protein